MPDFKEIHLGGGSPSYMNEDEFVQLINEIHSLVDIQGLDEFTIEIDAINVTKDKLKLYHDNGINRISFGIQDFDPHVQDAIGRVQSPRLLEDLLAPDTRGFLRASISILCMVCHFKPENPLKTH